MIKILLLTISIALPSTLWAIDTTSIRSEYTDLIQSGNQLFGLNETGNQYALTMVAGNLRSAITRAAGKPSRPTDILPDGQVIRGEGHIRQAWLGGPTNRYDHGVMADSIEASRLYAQNSRQQTVYLELAPNQVFEDRHVRYADLDDDGQDELIVIRTHIRTGAGIASYGLNNGNITLEAASDTIGLSHRWLNIVGIEDFTGNGKLEIAAVITPHIGGTLTLFEQNGKQLEPVIKQWGYSNHENGSRELGMSAVLDLNKDGIMDMVVPDENRRDIVLLTAKDKEIQILARIENKARIKSGIYAVDLDGDAETELVYLLKSGELVIVNL